MTPGMKYRIIIGATALRDLAKIFEYISADSDVNAARMIERILNSIDGLDEMRAARNGVRDRDLQHV